MSAEATAIAAAEVRVGDRIRTDDGVVVTVSRIDHDLLGWEGMLAFVEDTPERWLKAAAMAADEVELLNR